MTLKRINNILSTDEKIDVFYKNRPVWIQSISSKENIAKIGYVDDFDEDDVDISDLYE